MKRILSISCIAAAVLCLLALTVVPHHHHGSETCFSMEVCERAHECECDHGHQHEGQAEAHGSCVAESEFIAPQSDEDVKCGISSCDNHNDHISLFPVCLLAADLLTAGEEDPALKTDHGEWYALFYKSPESGRAHGLRAPPFRLS